MSRNPERNDRKSGKKPVFGDRSAARPGGPGAGPKGKSEGGPGFDFGGFVSSATSGVKDKFLLGAVGTVSVVSRPRSPRLSALEPSGATIGAGRSACLTNVPLPR